MSYPLVEDLLPHRPPMLWVDEVLFREGDEVHCKLTIRDSHVFVDDGHVDPVVAIEWMAQTVAALVGLYDRDNSRPIRPGYLIAVPEATFEVDAFAVGDELCIKARRIWGDDELASFECQVEQCGKLMARGQLSVYRAAQFKGEVR